MRYLLDNNVISELWKPRPESLVVSFVDTQEWFIPAPIIAELQEGAEATASAARKVQINARLDDFLAAFGPLVINWDAETARVWGRLKHSREVKQKPQPLWDSLIDAMAIRYGYTVATRNAADFRHAPTFNPWSGPPPSES